MSVDDRGHEAGDRARASFARVEVPDPFEVVAQRRRRHTRRTRAIALAVTIAIVAAAGAFASVATNGSSATDRRVQVRPTVTPFRLDPSVARCFPLPSDRAGDASEPSVHAWENWLTPLLVLGDDGTLWVVFHGHATEWSGPTADAEHSGIVWARWLGDGSILTARVGNSDVELERYEKPGQPRVAARLDYTIKVDAPAGSCPMNGYLATFGVVDSGVVLLPHSAGPLVHSCPPRSTPASCESPEGYSIEVRDPKDLRATGRPNGDSFGGPGIARTTIVSASRYESIIAIDEGSEVMTLDVDPGGLCCTGGQAGTAYAVSGDGRRLAYAARPDGKNLRIAGIGPHAHASDPGTSVTTLPYRADAMAWTAGATLAVAHGSTVSLIDTASGASRGTLTFPIAIRTLDVAP